MEIVVEQIVRKKMGTAGYILVIGIVLAMLLLPLLIIMIMDMAGLGNTGWTYSSVIVIFIVWGGINLFKIMGKEYEYTVTNGDMTVVKISAQRKRKHIVSVMVGDFERMGVYRSKDFTNQKFDTKLSCDSGAMDEQTWFATFHHKDFGNTILIFSPEERVLEAIKPYLKRQVSADAFTGN